MIKIEEMNLADLILYDKNPRNNQKAVPLVANSIKEFGFKNPIIIDKKERDYMRSYTICSGSVIRHEGSALY